MRNLPTTASLALIGRSLQTRLILLTLGCAVISLWTLIAWSGHALQKDLQRLLTEQQAQTVGLLASEIEQEFGDRMQLLQLVASHVTPAMLAEPAKAQAFLDERLHLPLAFSGGHFLIGAERTIIASVPTSLGRTGARINETGPVLEAVMAGRPSVSQVSFGTKLQSLVVSIVAPVRQMGKTVGVVAGVVDLGRANFLDKITAGAKDASVLYRVISVQDRRVVNTSEDPARAGTSLPAPGLNPVLDSLLQGDKTSVVAPDAQGQLLLSSAQAIPSAGWVLLAERPVAHAFAASERIQQQIRAFGILVTLLASALVWWVIQRQLKPMQTAAGLLRHQISGAQPLRALPAPDRLDEVGNLIEGFNQLLAKLLLREEELVVSEFRWKFAIEGAGDGVWDWNIEANSVFYSQRWKAMLGYADHEIGNDVAAWEDRIHPDDKAHALAHCSDYIEGRSPVYAQTHRLRCKDGSYKWILDRGLIVQRSPQGRALRVIGTHTDVTERVQAEEALRQLADSLKHAQAIAQLGSWTLDLRSGELRLSEQVFCLCEVPVQASDVTYEAFRAFIHPDDRRQVNRAYRHFLRNRQAFALIHRLQMPDGRVKWVEQRGDTECDAQGTALRFRGTLQDISASYLKDREVEASRDLLMSVITTVPTRVFWKDLDLRYLGCNQNFANDAGLASPQVLIGKDDHQLTWSPQAALYQADDRAVLASGEARLGYEEMQTTPEGKTIWLHTSKVPLRDSAGALFGILGVYDDITARKNAEFELALHREHLEEMVQQKTADLNQSVEDTHRALALLEQQKFVLEEHAIVTMSDMEGRITYGNRKFSEITGYEPADFLGRDHKFLNSGHHPQGFFKAMFDTIAAGRVWHAEVCNRNRAGELFWVDTTVAAFRGPDGRQSEYIAVRTDITERKKAEQAALAASRAKSEFLANMSHEIRTPMNGVIGLVELLLHAQPTPQQERMLTMVHESSLALLSILNDILDISKIEADKLQIEQVPTSLRTVLQSVVSLLRSTANGKDAVIQLAIDPALPAWMESDPTRLRQIVFNLLGNALKFIDKGPGQIGLQADKVQGDGGQPWLRLRISDNGIGMDAAMLSRLFQPFTQSDASTARKYGGTGLGLSITHRLVQMLGGHIQVSSTVGVGSTFVVDLPLKALAEQPVPTPAPLPAPLPLFRTGAPSALANLDAGRAPSVEQALAANQLLLVAEDNSINREVLIEQLALLGYRGETANDGLQALGMWRSGRYAMLLTDCHMPNMDGFELTAAIRREEPPGTHLPIVAVTANAMAGQAEVCLARGMDACLSKPLALPALQAALTQWLPAPARTAPTDSAAPAVWDAGRLHALIGNNPAMHRQLLRKYQEKACAQVPAMEQLQADGALAELGASAHTLKSAARSVGALALGEVCEALEAAAHKEQASECDRFTRQLRAAHEAAAAAIQQHLHDQSF